MMKGGGLGWMNSGAWRQIDDRLAPGTSLLRGIGIKPANFRHPAGNKNGRAAFVLVANFKLNNPMSTKQIKIIRNCLNLIQCLS